MLDIIATFVYNPQTNHPQLFKSIDIMSLMKRNPWEDQRKRGHFVWALLVTLALAGTSYGQVPPGFTLTELASGLSRPTNLQALPDGRFLNR